MLAALEGHVHWIEILIRFTLFSKIAFRVVFFLKKKINLLSDRNIIKAILKSKQIENIQCSIVGYRSYFTSETGFFCPAIKWLGHIMLPRSVISSFCTCHSIINSLSNHYLNNSCTHSTQTYNIDVPY